MLVMFEVEVRGPLTQEEYVRFDEFLEKNGKKVRDFDEFAVFYHSGSKHNFPIGALRIKKDDKVEKIVFKIFDVGAQEVNKELEIKLQPGEYKKMIQLIHHLGITHGDVAPCYRKDFEYNGMVISIKDKHMLGPHFEAEIIVKDEKDVEKVQVGLRDFIRKMGFRLWEGNDYTIHRDKVLKERGGPVEVVKSLN